MDNVNQQVVEHLKQARNILVTVRNDPTVDLLSACIGLTLALDKMDKHVAAVFSGTIPSTIEFLKPEETIEQSPDSLRDFIIALDKSKADKLRYKVEDKVVRIFITPYKTSLSQDDLQFSQGDFNVDAVVALGAHEQQELDQAITNHGRILHDATVISINNTPNGNLGSINWLDTSASSVSELVTSLVKGLDQNILDEQISTALLTGIVAETDRFSNERTSPKTMGLAGDLMSAGANQQLVATNLEEVIKNQVPNQDNNNNDVPDNSVDSENQAPKLSIKDDGTLEIEHQQRLDNQLPSAQFPFKEQPDKSNGPLEERDMMPLPEPSNVPPPSAADTRADKRDEEDKDNDEEPSTAGRSFLIDDPVVPGVTPLTQNRVEPSNINPFDMPPEEESSPIISRETPVDAVVDSSPPTKLTDEPKAAPLTSPPGFSDNDETLEEIEESVDSPHLSQQTKSSDLDVARHEVLKALQDSSAPPQPLISLNANPLGADLHPAEDKVVASYTTDAASQVAIDRDGNLKPDQLPKTIQSLKNLSPLGGDSEVNQSMDMPLPSVASNRENGAKESKNSSISPSNSPPPVPPPFMPNNFKP